MRGKLTVPKRNVSEEVAKAAALMAAVCGAVSLLVQKWVVEFASNLGWAAAVGALAGVILGAVLGELRASAFNQGVEEAEFALSRQNRPGPYNGNSPQPSEDASDHAPGTPDVEAPEGPVWDAEKLAAAEAGESAAEDQKVELTSTSSVADSVDELRALKEAHDEGLIDKSEWEIKRRQLIGLGRDEL